MMKKIALSVAAAVMATSLVACGASSEPEYVGVCVDPNTEQRLDDDACSNGDDDYLAYAVMWYMLANSSHSYPAVGHRVNRSYFKTTLPKGSSYTKGLSSKGGSSVKSWSSKTFGSKSSTGSSSKSGWGSSSKSSGGFSSSRSSGRR